MIRFLFAILLATGPARALATDLLLAASAEELAPLLSRLTDARSEQRAAWQFWTGRLGDKTVVITRSEGDPLNAVAATTLAIRRYAPKLVLTFGTARAHDPALNPGDVIVSRDFVAFDGIVSPPRALGAGSTPLAWQKLLHPLMSPAENETEQERFAADPKVLALATQLAAPRGRVVAGVLGSAHQVNNEADRIAWLRANWGTSSEDGESAHVAGTALLLGAPAFGVRVIDGRPGEAAAFVLRLLEVLP